MKKVLIFLMTVFVFFLISCSGSGDENNDNKSCDPACEAWQTCDNGTCKTSEGKCADDKDCKNGMVCGDDHTCKEKNDTECTQNSDCPTDKPVCDNGTCKAQEAECTQDSDCPTDKPVCDNGTCKEDNGGNGNCIGLSFDAIERHPNYKNAYYQIDGDNYLSISFFGATPAGTYDLGSGDNANYETCQQCVLVYTGASTEEDQSDDKAFFQTQGTMKIIKGDANEGEVEGEIINVKLQEVTIDEDSFHSTPVAGGGCFEIQTATWNTYPHCDEGATRCNGNVLETCNAESTWVTTTDCEANGNICNQPENGAASCVVCAAGTKRCSADKDVEVCKEDNSGWEVATDCQDPEVCIDEDGEVACGTPFVCEDHDLDGIGNDAEHAAELTFPVENKEGYVCKDVDDWYKFNLKRGDEIKVTLTFTHEDGDIDVKLFKGMPGEDADPVSSSASSDDNEEFTFQAIADDTYYLQIVSHYVKKGNGYTLNITKTDACTDNASCTEGDKNLCNSGICVECMQDSDCEGNSKCSEGVCFEVHDSGCIGVSFDIRAEATFFGTFYLSDTDPYHLSVQFFEETPVGSYDLGTGDNSNYETCKQCLLAYSLNEAGDLQKYFFQTQGTLEVLQGEAKSGESEGKITNIKLQEVTIDDQGEEPTYHSTVVEGGECIEIETGSDSWTWNSMGEN